MSNKPLSNRNNPSEMNTSIVSVQKARRILGSTAKSMSDNQVRELIHTLHLLAKEQLVYTGSKDYVSGTPNRTS